MTDAERREALDAIAREVAACTRCRLHAGRMRAVPGEGSPDTEVVFVGEGPGFNEDREGRPFVGRAGDLLVRLLASIGWRREDVFITNVVKCRPPDNRDPQPDEIAACAPFLTRQLAVLDPALVVTLGRHSMGRFMPGARIGQVHGTHNPADHGTGARDALVYAMYHPAAALRTTDIERQSYADVAGVPVALLESRRRREQRLGGEVAPGTSSAPSAIESAAPASPGPTHPGDGPSGVGAAIEAPATETAAAAVTTTEPDAGGAASPPTVDPSGSPIPSTPPEPADGTDQLSLF